MSKKKKKRNNNQSLLKRIGAGLAAIIAGISINKIVNKTDASTPTPTPVPEDPKIKTVSQHKTENVKYIIRENDTLMSIAEYFKASIYDITIVNELNLESPLNVGVEIIIPNVSSEIAKEYYNIKEQPKIIEYTIKEGDTLESIAQKFNTTIDIIASSNNITNVNKIYIDDVLIIPVIPTKNITQIDNSSTLSKANNTIKISYNQGNNLPEGFIRGIDISEMNGKINWDSIENSINSGKYQYVILRMADNYGNGKRQFSLDEEFERNLSECNKRGIPYGVYIFSRGSTVAEINTETNAIINYINTNLNQTKFVDGQELDLTFNLSLPLYMDCFEPDASRQFDLYEERKYDYCESLINQWCGAIEDAGYFPGVYCSGSFYKDMGSDRLSKYTIWVAHYGNKPVTDNVENIELNGKVEFEDTIKSQQVTERGKTEGIEGYVDVNISHQSLIDLVQEYYSIQSHNRYR